LNETLWEKPQNERRERYDIKEEKGDFCQYSFLSRRNSMKARKPLIGLAVAVALLCWGVDESLSQKGNPSAPGQQKKITQTDRQDAAARALQEGAVNPLMVDMMPAMVMPGDAPRYFSHPNYANSPLPTVDGAVISFGNDLIDRAYASDFPVGVGELAPVFVVVPTALPDGMLQSFQVWNQAAQGASPFPSAGNVFHAYVLRPTANANEYTVVFDSGLLTMPALADPAVSEIATFGVANLAVQAGDVLAFYGQGIPVDTGAGADVLSYPAPTPPLQDSMITLGSTEYPIYPQPRTYSFEAQVLDLSGQNTMITGGMKKFVDTLPGLNAANNLGQQIPVAVPDTTTYPDDPTTPDVDEGADYYVIELGEYTEQMHSDLPPTTLRGYRQAGGEFHYLGPAIVAQKDRPVRILFRNLLPTGAGGNLFIPVDSTVMGSGMTAAGHEFMEANPDMVDPQNPMCSTPDPMMKEMMVADGLCYAENRATLHLHGGISPWISDGTPHQWITPAGENTAYPEGVSVEDVPDMPAPGPGEMTFFYTNQQSARLMFYHDHAWGITRLNVYAGEAAPYIITDDTEAALVDQGIIPGPEATIPLVIQDKTFVPGMEQLMMQDETWDTARWGGEGSLWVPHVYSPAQNPGDASGVNEFGRWAYGPWFWPPTNNVDFGPMPNPYYDPACDPDLGWCEPPLMPGVPYLSMGMESFNDTPVVNGTAYPTLTVEPKAYRFRILNAANDRFFNLSLYQAVDANGVLCDAANPNPAPESTGVACTEVFLNPDEVAAALQDGTVFPTPVTGTEGPEWIAIGTEGGFLPSPVVIPAHPTTWVNDPTVFNAGNVDQHSLLTAPAERHDVIVDFSQYAGQTLILYNDAPAAFPARDPRYDYYTGNGDYRDTGGAPSTLPGYGPNTRTVMQIKVAAAAPAPAFDLAALENAFKATSLGGQGVFELGQNPIIVGQGEYNQAYGTSFKFNGPENGTVQIYDTSLTFKTLLGDTLTMNLKPKMIQDEMGEAFELEYGRMSGFLGVETPNAQAGLQNMILHGYTYPPDEILDAIELPAGVALEPIAATDDGTQIWKFTHNGVDTHPIHFHLYDVQLLNRVGWDGIVRKPDANELGWKDTVRISPLEDTIVALRPVTPYIPDTWGGLPNSIRLLDPSMPEGMYLMGANTTQREAAGLPLLAFNPDGEPVDIVNHYVNFGWEYVYHCHILSHEEMDMMHAQVVGVAPAAPTFVSAIRVGNGNQGRYDVTWFDNSKNETSFVIERREAGTTDAWTNIATVESTTLGVWPYVDTGLGLGTGLRTYADPIGNTKTLYEYQVYAINVVGDVWDYSDPAFNEIPPGGGWPTLTLDSRGGSYSAIEVPTGLTGSAVTKNKKTATVTLNWTDNATIETGFLIQRADNIGFSLGVVNATVGADITTFTQTVSPGKTFYYRVLAFNDTIQSGWSNTTAVTTP
jgi:FtsP/CotA-like multicopper oxidase with cupredoxin domain